MNIPISSVHPAGAGAVARIAIVNSAVEIADFVVEVLAATSGVIELNLVHAVLEHAGLGNARGGILFVQPSPLRFEDSTPALCESFKTGLFLLRTHRQAVKIEARPSKFDFLLLFALRRRKIRVALQVTGSAVLIPRAKELLRCIKAKVFAAARLDFERRFLALKHGELLRREIPSSRTSRKQGAGDGHGGDPLHSLWSTLDCMPRQVEPDACPSRTQRTGKGVTQLAGIIIARRTRLGRLPERAPRAAPLHLGNAAISRSARLPERR